MITENLDLFFADFGVSITADAISGLCLKDMPGLQILGDQVLEIDHQALVKTDQFGWLLYGDPVIIADEGYTVQDCRPIEDGVFSLITLEKSAAPVPPVIVLDDNDSDVNFIFDSNP